MANVGVKSFDVIYFMNTFSIKREFLFFDKIYYNEETLKISGQIGEWLSSAFRQDNGQLAQYKMKEIEDLIQENRLVPFKPFEVNSPDECSKFSTAVDLEHLMNDIEKFSIAKKNAIKQVLKKDDKIMDWTQQILKNSMRETDFEAILMARILTYKGMQCTPLLHNRDNPYANSRAIFINQVIESFPLLTIETTWESILSFKNNPEVKRMILTLNNWIVDFSKMDLTAEEFRTKIAFYQQEYEDHLSIYKEKVQNLKMESLIIAPLAILENLLKIKWSEVGKYFSEQKKASLNLKAKKLELKGREVAYISKIYEIFDNPKSQLVKGIN